ncbi:MAG: epimerase [Rhodoferax sp.]
MADLAALPALARLDDCFIALGTTIKAAGSQAAFRAVDYDAVLAVARAARAAGASRLGLVSALGADPRSTVFYSRVKGEAEAALGALGFQSLVLARPALLAGDRAATGQRERSGERIGLAVAGLLRPLIPANYRSIAAADVAQALVDALHRSKSGTHALTSAAMQGAARR